MGNTTLHPEFAKTYDYLRRDFARLCVALDALQSGLTGAFTIYGTDERPGFTVDLAEAFEYMHRSLASVENMVHLPYEPNTHEATVGGTVLLEE